MSFERRVSTAELARPCKLFIAGVTDVTQEEFQTRKESLRRYPQPTVKSQPFSRRTTEEALGELEQKEKRVARSSQQLSSWGAEGQT